MLPNNYIRLQEAAHRFPSHALLGYVPLVAPITVRAQIQLPHHYVAIFAGNDVRRRQRCAVCVALSASRLIVD